MKNLTSFCVLSPWIWHFAKLSSIIFATIQELEFNPILAGRACSWAVMTPDPLAAGQVWTGSAPV
jgi:hypothetical protein